MAAAMMTMAVDGSCDDGDGCCDEDGGDGSYGGGGVSGSCNSGGDGGCCGLKNYLSFYHHIRLIDIFSKCDLNMLNTISIFSTQPFVIFILRPSINWCFLNPPTPPPVCFLFERKS